MRPDDKDKIIITMLSENPIVSQDEMAERDRRDSERAAAPLKPADDAFVLDTSDLDIEAAHAAALSYLRSRLEPREAADNSEE